MVDKSQTESELSRQKETLEKLEAASAKSTDTSSIDTATTTDTTQVNNNLVVKEWGIKFKIPTNLTDPQYRIYNSNKFGETLAIFAKPKDYPTVQCKSDYQDFDNATDEPKYLVGVVYRSK